MTLAESEIVSYLVEEWSPELVLLGGSRATGTERHDSDWDLYLIGDFPEENQRLMRNFRGEHLDIALFPKQSLHDSVLRIYYGPLQALRPLVDNEQGEAAAIVAATKAAYNRGPRFPSAERKAELAEDAARILSKIEGYASEPAVAQFHMSHYYQLILPAWFELRGRWSLPAHQALPLIRREDLRLADLLGRFSTGEFKERVTSCRAILERLLGFDPA